MFRKVNKLNFTFYKSNEKMVSTGTLNNFNQDINKGSL